MVTIKKIAEIAGVSRGTVDRVLNNRDGVSKKTYDKVRKVADSLGYEPNMAGQMLAAYKKKIRLAFIIFDTQKNLFFRDVYEAAKRKAEELKSYGVTMQFYLIEELSDEFIEPLLKKVEEDEPDGIALAPMSTESIKTFVKRMNEKGTPLVFYNMDMEGAQRLSYVGCDYYKAGKVAAGLAALVSGERGKIAVATNFDIHSPSFRQRMDGFLQEIDNCYPDIEVVNRDCSYVFEKNNFENIIEVIENNPEIDVLYIINPGDYSICERIAQMDRRIRIITNDVVREQKDLMDRGVIVATISQQPEQQGALSLQILYDYIALGIERENVNFTELTIYIRQNITLAAK